MRHSIEELRAVFAYDPETGALWRQADGAPAFRSCDTHGYPHHTFEGVTYLGHRLAWALHYGCWPADQLDHDNGVRADLRLLNLKEATGTQNARNAKLRVDNKSGVPGVGWNKQFSKWAVRIGAGSQRKFIGYFKALDDAIAARKAAEHEQGYHPNHGRIAA